MSKLLETPKILTTTLLYKYNKGPKETTSTTTGTLVVAGGVGIAGNIYVGSGLISLTNGTSNFINFNSVGFTAPTFTTRSAGTKIILFSDITASKVDYAIGVETGTIWSSVPQAAPAFKHLWYGGVTQLMNVSVDGRSCSLHATVYKGAWLLITKSLTFLLYPRSLPRFF